MITFLCTLLVATPVIVYVHYQLLAPKKQHFGSHLYIFGHIKSRLGKMVLINNESLEEGDGDALRLE